jgi:paraquat-inducible protein A
MISGIRLKTVQRLHKKKNNSHVENDQPENAYAYLPTATDLSLIVCHSCGKLNPLSLSHHPCTRCQAILHQRKPSSLDRTWALMLSAMIMYIPANLLPMTITDSLFGEQQDTILSGVIYFWKSSDYLVASVIFTASILIPMLKLMILTFLLIAVHQQESNKKRWRPEQCATLYRVVEFIGRWSMIDVFVVSLLTALIQIQSLASISAGPGAVAFGAVVVLTMLASLSFDPRIIWDNYCLGYQNKSNQNNIVQNPDIVNHEIQSYSLLNQNYNAQRIENSPPDNDRKG